VDSTKRILSIKESKTEASMGGVSTELILSTSLWINSIAVLTIVSGRLNFGNFIRLGICLLKRKHLGLE
jgi:hypothetical protein